MRKPTQNKQKNNTPKKKPVKLDQILKLLFKVSNRTLVNTINGLFNENFEPDDITVNVSKTATELIKDTLDVLRADMFLKLVESDKRRHFHIEYQLSPNSPMGLRVFEYGILKALELNREENTDDIILPKSIVIHFEESGSIPDQYKKGVVFPNRTRNEYTVDVIKYWTLSDTTLINKKLYNLLPLQIFTLRAELDKITAAGTEQSKEAATTTAKEAVNKIIDVVKYLHQENEIDADDHDKIITGLAELIRHLDERYKLNQKLSGVNDVIKVLNIAKKAEKRAENKKALEIAKKLLDVLDVQTIAERTGVSTETLEKLKKNKKAES